VNEGVAELRLDALVAELAEVPGVRPVGIRAVEIGRGALQRLPRLLARFVDPADAGAVVVLVDGVPMKYAGSDLHDAVVALLAGVRAVRTVVVRSQNGQVHADADTLEYAVQQVSGAAAIVTVGSGTLADIGKAVSAQLGGLLHIVVQTALSVNGFSDDQSVLLLNGVKRTTHTRWPDVLVADTDVLSEAPEHLNAAGIGDLLAMFTAPADWRLASLLGMGDGYGDHLVSMVRDNGPGLLDAARRLKERDPEAIEYVARVLTLSGISMGAAGTTAPSSGAEHTMSHLIEMSCNQQGLRSAFHGAQVGACTVLASLVWKRVRALVAHGPVQLSFPSETDLEQQVLAAFESVDASGAMGEECWRLYRVKLARWNANSDRIAGTDWAALDAAVSPLLAEPAALVDALTGAGAPTRFRDLDPPVGADTVRWALASCHLMRDRFTVVDLAFFLGAWGPGVPGEILAEAGRLGAGL
jgi:glycerol-1-phosphate dehydrogenase [NAD(P)+]